MPLQLTTGTSSEYPGRVCISRSSGQGRGHWSICTGLRLVCIQLQLCVTCCQAQVRAGVANDTSKVDYEELPPGSLQRRRDANEHTSMQLSISRLNQLTACKRIVAVCMRCPFSFFMTNVICSLLLLVNKRHSLRIK